MRTKDLALKNVPFNQIASGKKKTEYRDLKNLYYINTFCNVDSYTGKSLEQVRDGLLNGSLTFRPSGYTHLRFHNTGRTCLVEIKGFRIDKKNKLLCIDLGKVLSGKAVSNVPE